jgi:predicted nuclease of predicted toxin-antitoxin system
VKFLVDECLSHSYVAALRRRGYPDAVHPINIGLLGRRDDTIVEHALAEDRIIITSNARDYMRLLSRMTIHPGAIVVQALTRDRTWHLILAALAFIELQARPADYMVNRVIEASATDGIRPYALLSDAG